MYKMVMALAFQDDVKINANTFELVVETLIAEDKWAETLLLLREMERHHFRPTIDSCVKLIYLLERSRQYRAALAMYRYMLRHDYDFYENDILNEVFKKVMSIASMGSDLRNAVKETMGLDTKRDQLSPMDLLQQAIESS